MERFVCIAIGYLFGLFQTGYIYGKMKGIDIRQQGSGNAGTTNALRTLGIKAGAITFLGDAFKCIFAVLAVYLIYGKSHADTVQVLGMYAGIGAVLGHNYPFYMNFKGGKGIAVTAGIVTCTGNLYIFLACLLVFVVIVACTRYVSLGSLAVVTVYFVGVLICGQMGGFHVQPPYLYEMYGIALLLMISAFHKHHANIKRLLSGTENKISFGKK